VIDAKKLSDILLYVELRVDHLRHG
jgi:hypothetical protein